MDSSIARAHKLTQFALEGDGTCRLAINEEGWMAAGEESRERGNPTSNVVAFLGRTHAGKSFICAEILKRLGMAGGPVIAVDGTMTPTSSDVNSYHGRMRKSGRFVRLLDCEGEGGRVAPKELLDTTGWTRDIVRQQRSVVVEKYLPRVAYVCSEVVIYVTRDDLSDVRCIEEVCRFALDQTNNAHAVKPFLIIISNRNEYASETIEQTTKEFYDTHDPEEELHNHYREIKVQRVPMKDRSPEDFESRLNELILTIDDMLERKIPERDQLGIHYNEVIWLLVFNILITEYFDLDKPIHFGEVIQKAVIPKEDFFVHQVFRLFVTINQYLNQYFNLYDADSEHSTVHKSFHTARALAIEMLGALHAADISEWAVELGANVVKSPVHLKDRQDAAMKDFEKLGVQMSTYAPCTAVYNRKGTLIPCVRQRMEHDSNQHCNPAFKFHEKEMLADDTSGFLKTFNKVKKKYHRLQNKSFPAKWEGSYQFNDPVTSAELQEIFMATMKKLENDLPIDKSRIMNAVARVAIVRKAFPINLSAPSELSHLGSVSDQTLRKCIVCLSTHKHRDARVSLKQLTPCGHTFCEVCIDPFRLANGEEQVSVLSGESTLNGSCPLCHSRVAQLSEVA